MCVLLQVVVGTPLHNMAMLVIMRVIKFKPCRHVNKQVPIFGEYSFGPSRISTKSSEQYLLVDDTTSIYKKVIEIYSSTSAVITQIQLL